MVKPIFTIGLPNEVIYSLNDERRNAIISKIPDYHVLIYPSTNGKTEFKAFYEKPITDIEFAELKELVLNELNK